jgi:hypothetical protein
MAMISILGKVDKRILVLPLMRVCSMDGPTVVYSDDGNFKNLFHEEGNEGCVSGVDIFVTNEIPDSELIQMEYKHLIYVYSDPIELDSKMDVSIVCRCFDRSFLGLPKAKLSETSNHVDVIFSSIPLKNVKNVIVLRPEYYRYLVETEEKKELLINKDKTICRLMTLILSNVFSMSELQFSRLLVRNKYELSMK